MLFAHSTRTAGQPKAAIVAIKTALGTALSEDGAAAPRRAPTQQAPSTPSETPPPALSPPKAELNTGKIKKLAKDRDESRIVHPSTDEHTAKHSDGSSMVAKHFEDTQEQPLVFQVNEDANTIGHEYYAATPCSKPRPAPSVYEFCECRLRLAVSIVNYYFSGSGVVVISYSSPRRPTRRIRLSFMCTRTS